MKVLKTKKFFLSPTQANMIVPTPQDKLESERTKLIKQMFNYNSLIGQKYQKFIFDFINYTAGMFNLKNIKVAYDSSCVGSEGYHMDDELTVGLGKFLYSRPSYPEKFFDCLNTIIHEFSHSKELDDGIYTYKKFSNENDAPVRNDLNQALTEIGCYMFERQRNQMRHYGLSTYYLSPWEMLARKTANDEMGKILQDAKKLIKEKVIPATKETYDLFKRFSAQQQRCLDDEKRFQKTSKMFLTKNNNAYKFTKQCVEDILDYLYKSNDEPKIHIVSNILPLFYDTKLTNQAQLNKFNNYLLKQAKIAEDDEIASIMLSYALCLALTKPNTKSSEHFANVYKFASVLENKKFPNLMNKLQYEVVDFLIKQPYFTVDKMYVENEYKKYHTTEEFEKYYKRQKEQEKNNEKNKVSFEENC